MEHTWHAHHLPRLAVANLEGGDVVLCGSAAERARVASHIDEERLGFIAPLDSRSDLEWLLRGLSLHPNIRHVVVHGDDPTLAGNTLLALWREGLGEGGRLPGSRGVLSPELDREAVNRLRHRVEVSDLRRQSFEALAKSLAQLARGRGVDAPDSAGASIELPNPSIPERQVFLSRKTSFPIFTSDVADGWLQLLNLALRIGTEKETPDGQRIAEALNAVVTIETPVLEDGEQEHERDAFAEFLDFDRDDFDHHYFPHYAGRLRGHPERDRFESACARLAEDPNSVAGTLVCLEPGALDQPDTAGRLISATFNTVEGRLYGSFVMRSVNVYTDWPLEAMALVRLQREAAERLGLELGSSTFVIHSAHLYERDFHRSQRVLDDFFKRPLPLHVDPSGVFLFGNDGGKARAMLLNHDASAIQWEEAFSDPEDLSWYIVDVMPWLLPQHIRYVGQECASLMRAMREKECYLQG